VVHYTRERIAEFGTTLDERVRTILAQGGTGATVDITGTKPSMQIVSDYYYPQRLNR
jgi:hypothetical protein